MSNWKNGKNGKHNRRGIHSSAEFMNSALAASARLRSRRWTLLSQPKNSFSGKVAVLFALPFLTLAGWAALAAPPARSPKSAALPKPIPAPTSAPAVTAEDAQFFETKIRPLLAEHCYSCHGDKVQQSGLRLDTRQGLLKGGMGGLVLHAGKPDESALVRAVRYDGALKMPPAGKLSAAQIADLTEWVKRGGTWPESGKSEIGSGEKNGSGKVPANSAFPYPPDRKNFWSFKPVKNPPLPAVKDLAWCKSPLDRFVLARLEAKGIKPAPPADKRTLLRRVTFDLTGLPPTPEEIDAFLADKSPDAYAKVVDRLLASPSYGERWARHWLDLVRYADSLDARGVGSEGDIAFAWKYRDWVVNAFNRDLPYNQFLKYQIAGDLMGEEKAAKETRRQGEEGKNASFSSADGIIATGLLAIGNWGNGDADKDKILTDIADDQVDVISRGMMGLTVACARCHDHKFDPIPTKDYYGLAGIFFSTHILPKLTPKGAGENILRVPLDTPQQTEQRARYQRELNSLEAQFKQERETQITANAKNLLPQTAQYVAAAWQYQHRPGVEAGVTVEDFAKRQGLQAWALRQWRDFLGLGEYRLMTQSVADAGGHKGMVSWRGAPDCPNALINTNDTPRTISTLTVPPRSVAVHPGPTNGVVVAWRSPIAGTVKITGRVVDADPNGGDGIAWVLEHRSPGGAQELASGDFPNGGAQDFAQGKNAGALQDIAMHPGDRLELLVLPKENYGFDTTVVDLTITEMGTSGAAAQPGTPHAWNLSRDLMADPLKGNPHADSFNNPGVWQFEDMADTRRNGGQPSAANPALAAWRTTTATATLANVQQASQTFAQTFTLADKSSPFWINNSQDETALPPSGRDALARLTAQLDTLKKSPPPPLEYANAAQDGGVPESPHAGVHDVAVHIRGNYARLGEMARRHFPVVLAGEHQLPITQGSGRLELAEWLASDTHPLTPRVIVNRVWQHHFGKGIVGTPSNFGFLGEPPTNPELLDWLASNFVASTSNALHPTPSACDWSLKKLHRLILLSATYQQASEGREQTVKADPDNRLFGRMNRQRLEAEAVRDNLLAVAGKLDVTPGGVAYRDFNTPRRTLYLMTIRSDRSGFGPLWDMADSTASVDRRTVSTVAPQSLYLLNNPFVLEQARALAQRLAKEIPEGANSETARIQRAYVLLYGRPATPEEIAIGRNFLSRARKTPPLATAVANPPAPKADTTAWEEYGQILLCANEFLYVD